MLVTIQARVVDFRARLTPVCRVVILSGFSASKIKFSFKHEQKSKKKREKPSFPLNKEKLKEQNYCKSRKEVWLDSC